MNRTLEPRARGALSQRRYLDSVAILREDTPSWFIGLILGDFELDLRGVDAIAYITYPGEYRVSRVPIQIKSSYSGIREFEEEQKKYGGENIVVVLVRDDISSNQFRRYTFTELQRIRAENIRFDDYFARLFAQQLSNGAEMARQRLIRAKMQYQIPKGKKPPRLPARKLWYETTPREQTPVPAQPEVVARPNISRWRRFWRAVWRWSFPPAPAEV